MLKCSNAQMPNAKCSNTQMPKCTNAQMLNYPNAQMLKILNLVPSIHLDLSTTARASWRLSNAPWRTNTVFATGLGAERKVHCDASTYPIACSLVHKLQSLLQTQLQVDSNTAAKAIVRVGYSSLAAQGHIRPHCGGTNGVLKLHLGLDVPTGNDGKGCTTLRVANGIAKPGWVAGEVTGLDDSFEHEVWNECASTRVVLQVALRHPAMLL